MAQVASRPEPRPCHKEGETRSQRAHPSRQRLLPMRLETAQPYALRAGAGSAAHQYSPRKSFSVCCGDAISSSSGALCVVAAVRTSATSAVAPRMPAIHCEGAMALQGGHVTAGAVIARLKFVRDLALAHVVYLIQKA